jgi:hypothetical protein
LNVHSANFKKNFDEGIKLKHIAENYQGIEKYDMYLQSGLKFLESIFSLEVSCLVLPSNSTPSVIGFRFDYAVIRFHWN